MHMTYRKVLAATFAILIAGCGDQEPELVTFCGTVISIISVPGTTQATRVDFKGGRYFLLTGIPDTVTRGERYSFTVHREPVGGLYVLFATQAVNICVTDSMNTL